jgi:hypothetical protein
MDWSLIDPYSHYRLLRDHLAFKRVWMYYVAMIIDPILRFNWIFYAIYADEVQHSAILSFIVSLSEVFRRGIWTVFRVENEHCTNVGRFRASRDVPLPYKIKRTHEQTAEQGMLSDVREDEEGDDDEEGDAREAEQRRQGVSVSPSLSRTQSTGVDLSRQRTQDSESTMNRPRRRRAHTVTEPSPLIRGLNYVGNLLHTAHAQDFERKKRPPAVDGNGDENGKSDSDDDDDEEGTDKDEQEGEEEEANQIVDAEERKDHEEGNGGPSGGGSGTEGGGPGKMFSFQPRRQDDEEARIESGIDGNGIHSPGGTVRRQERKVDVEE